MADEPSQEMPVTTEGTEAPIETPVSTPEPVAAPTFDWKAELDKADVAELRKHPRIAGIIGSENQRAIQTYEQRKGQEWETKKKQETEAGVLKMFEDNIDYIRQNHPEAYEYFTGMQKQNALNEVEGLRGKTRQEFAEAVGKANAETWAKLSPDRQTYIATELSKLDDDLAIPAFNRLMVEEAANMRAEELYNQRFTKELDKAKEAWQQSAAAQGLLSNPAPELKRPNGTPSGVNISDLSDAEFDDLWNTRIKH